MNINAIFALSNTVRGKTFHYLAFAENRPLKTLYMMIADPFVKFSQHNFNLQFKIYKRELGKLLDSDRDCRDRYLILHYRVSSVAFTNEINKLVDRYKMHVAANIEKEYKCNL